MRTSDRPRQTAGPQLTGWQDGTPLAQYAGPPRIVIWRGGAAHVRAVNKAGHGPDLHAHFGIQLTVGFNGEVVLRGGRRARTQSAEGWLIDSDQPHLLQGHGVSASFFLDPLSAVGRRASTILGAKGMLPLSPDVCRFAREGFARCWARGWKGADLQALAAQLILKLAPEDAPLHSMDLRVQEVIDRLLSDPSENASLDDLAASVGLSESRLAHLFRQEVGIPMRQYRLTLRMEEAIKQMSSGRSFTDSAHMAGFADAAHFCRICRRMFGNAPSGLPKFQLGKDQR